MKSKTKMTQTFNIEIPQKQVVKALLKAGYEIPKDAHLVMHSSFSAKTILYISWTRDEDVRRDETNI